MTEVDNRLRRALVMEARWRLRAAHQAVVVMGQSLNRGDPGRFFDSIENMMRHAIAVASIIQSRSFVEEFVDYDTSDLARLLECSDQAVSNYEKWAETTSSLAINNIGPIKYLEGRVDQEGIFRWYDTGTGTLHFQGHAAKIQSAIDWMARLEDALAVVERQRLEGTAEDLQE